MSLLPANGTIHTVSDFTESIRYALESTIPEGWVRGEVSNLRRQSSGHIYFSLKDTGAQISCVLFRGDAMRQTTPIRDGMQLLAFGRISVYAPRGNYQLIVRQTLEDGIGRLQQAFEALKQKLATEGLFDSERKQSIPRLPRTVGVITSPTGAALRDFVSVLMRRNWRGKIIVLPARVQGAEAADEIISQIKNAEACGKIDLLVVCRGGGSLEDLWCFNEEVVVRAVAACPIPIISGVGHEIDFTLTDFAADLRAETPTAAAEHIAHNANQCQEAVDNLARELRQTVEHKLERVHVYLERLEGRLQRSSPQSRLEYFALRLDELKGRLDAGVHSQLREHSRRFTELKHTLRTHKPESQVRQAELQLQALRRRLATTLNHQHQRLGIRLQTLEQRLHAASYQQALKRGFSITRDAQGNIVTHAQRLTLHDSLNHEFIDGTVESVVTKISPK